MNYPENFFTRMFAAGRGLELARRFAIYSGILLFLIAALSGMIYWARRSERARPYFLYMDGGDWLVYGTGNAGLDLELPWYRTLMESVAVKYAADYMRVSGDMAENGRLWKKCGDCAENPNDGKICCASSARVFDGFESKVLRDWQRRFGNGETLELSVASASPVGHITERGGLWKITGKLASNKGAGDKKIIAFVRMERAREGYAASLGYYVSEFDFYAER